MSGVVNQTDHADTKSEGKGLVKRYSYQARKWQVTAVAFLAVLFISGCNPKAIPTVIFPAKPEAPEPPKPEPPKSVPASVNLLVRDNINPDTDGKVSPVQVRIFLADDSEAFKRPVFEQIFEFSGEQFNVKPLAVRTVRSGSVESIKLEIEPAHEVLAVAVGFRDISKAKWIEAVNLDIIKSSSFNFILSDNKIDYQPNAGDKPLLPSVDLFLEQ